MQRFASDPNLFPFVELMHFRFIKDKLCTTVVPRMTKRHAMELSASRKARRQLLDQSPSGGSSTADSPNIPGWLEPHIVYLEGITSDEPWCRLLELWKGIEAKNAADSYKSV